jgi:hypothetical protein
MQLAMVVIPIALLIYVVFFSSPESTQRRGIELTNYMSYGGRLVMLFTIVWFPALPSMIAPSAIASCA